MAGNYAYVRLELKGFSVLVAMPRHDGTIALVDINMLAALVHVQQLSGLG